MSPDQVLAMLQSAINLHKAGKIPEAESGYWQVLQIAPNAAVALHNIGLIRYAAKKYDEAMDLMRRSLAQEANIPLFYRNLGSVYRVAGRAGDAVPLLERAVAMTPDDGVTWAEYGISLDMAGRVEEALPIYEKAVCLLTPLVTPLPPGTDTKPPDGTPTLELARAYYNVGSVYGRWNKPVEALAGYEAAIRIVPAFAEAHRSRSGILFQRGQLAEAWSEYEWRWRCADYPGTLPKFRQPKWDGTPVVGKTILLWWEQGFGDTIQFCRYATILADRGAKVVLLVQKELKRLIKTLRGPSILLENYEKKVDFDIHASLMSLPYLAGTTLHTIPSEPAYLQADPAESAVWETRLAADGPGLRVGIAWAGAAAHKFDHLRSIPLSTWMPILSTPNAKFYNLQFGPPAREMESLPESIRLIDHTSHLHDFADTAALVDRLDLVICVDTALAHLTAAIGKPVWSMLQHEPDFRWMADNDNPSRWYPGMRFFRQPTPGDWKSVLEGVAAELGALISPEKP